MKFNAGTLIVRALRDENIRYGFGIPGTHNIELYDAMAEAETFTPILVTDEQGASFMADGLARASGRLAVVNVVPGAGLTHALSGIAEAYLDGVPLLVLACGIRQDTGAAFQLHEVDQVSIARPVCKNVFQPTTHAEVYRMVREACHHARQSPPGPVLVEVPANLYFLTGEVEEKDFEFHLAAERPQIDLLQVDAIAQRISACKRLGIYAGLGAMDASEALMELADRIDALVFTTISGKGVFPEDHPRFAWNLLGAAAPGQMQSFEEELDCLVAIGCRFGEVATASYGLKPPKNLIHIDIDEKVFNKNYPASLTLRADAGDALRALLASPKLPQRTAHTARLSALAHAHAEVRKEQGSTTVSSERVSPFHFFRLLQTHLGPPAIYVTDSGNGTFLAMEHLRLTQPRSFLGPIDYSCMGYSVPAAIGAKLGCPERPVVALVGDGAFLMTGMELLTAVRYEIPVLFCILRDGELSQIAQFQRASLHRETCAALPPLNFQPMASALGIRYLNLSNDAEIEGVLAEATHALSENQPVLLEVKIDYSHSTYFSKGVIKTNFLRFSWKDRLRLVGRVLTRKMFKPQTVQH